MPWAYSHPCNLAATPYTTENGQSSSLNGKGIFIHLDDCPLAVYARIASSAVPFPPCACLAQGRATVQSRKRQRLPGWPPESPPLPRQIDVRSLRNFPSIRRILALFQMPPAPECCVRQIPPATLPQILRLPAGTATPTLQCYPTTKLLRHPRAASHFRPAPARPAMAHANSIAARIFVAIR